MELGEVTASIAGDVCFARAGGMAENTSNKAVATPRASKTPAARLSGGSASRGSSKS